MMSTAVLKSVGQATHYYTDNGNYYADDAKGNSQWYGKGADKLGLAGDVDIISSYWAEDDSDRFSRNYATPLQESIGGMQWYLKMQTQNTDLFCAMQSVVHEIAMARPRPYYKNITLEAGCNK